MGRRDNAISKAILQAVFDDKRDDNTTVLSRILAFFTLFSVSLSRYDAALFHKLRVDSWGIDENGYRESFKTSSGGEKKKLEAIGDLGYSGSTFFRTPNAKFLVKSIPRPSEYHFFKKEMLPRYADHMTQHPNSLLVRITDFLHHRYYALGTILSLTPSHHIVMENILFGQDSDTLGDKWQTFDLKPVDYFYPERDIAGGMLVSADVKKKLVDTFEDRVRVTAEQRTELLETLRADTALLEACNAIDYSIFLVRYPKSDQRERNVEVMAATTSPWRAGIESTDSKWVYRAVVLDFFWAKHKTQAKLMTGLINSYNFISRRVQPMSITTQAHEYRDRFLRMVEKIVVDGNAENPFRDGA